MKARHHLSPRQRAVARHLLLGWGRKRIATELGISLETVRLYTERIFDEVGADSRTEAAMMILHSEAWLHEIYDHDEKAAP